ncbi:unnamed protein product, partial [Rotaria magnacalcarata]
NEQQQSDSENILEASTSSATTATTRTKIRKATSEIEDTDSPYDNALQIKLDLKPNEYRRGQYSFDIFINEYANEKLEIKKE